MELQTPWVGILGAIAMLFWAISFWKLGKKAELRLPIRKAKYSSLPLRLVFFVVGLAGWLCLIYSSMTPRKALKFLPDDIEVNDIYFVVDVSRSMLADDLKPNRLEVAKLKLREFAKLRPTDRIGIIMFSERVFTLLPLTTDPKLVDQMLSDIKIGFLGSGTNIGDALALAVGRGQASKTKNKVVILLTDGVNNVGNIDPIKAAKMAAEYKMKVYTIGLGTLKNARIPIGKNAFGTQYQSIPGGSIDLKTLREISSLTDGKHYMADSEESLEEILAAIQELEKTKIKSRGKVIYEEKYLDYLVWGLVLLLSSMLGRRYLLKEIV